MAHTWAFKSSRATQYNGPGSVQVIEFRIESPCNVKKCVLAT